MLKSMLSSITLGAAMLVASSALGQAGAPRPGGPDQQPPSPPQQQQPGFPGPGRQLGPAGPNGPRGQMRGQMRDQLRRQFQSRQQQAPFGGPSQAPNDVPGAPGFPGASGPGQNNLQPDQNAPQAGPPNGPQPGGPRFQRRAPLGGQPDFNQLAPRPQGPGAQGQGPRGFGAKGGPGFQGRRFQGPGFQGPGFQGKQQRGFAAPGARQFLRNHPMLRRQMMQQFRQRQQGQGSPQFQQGIPGGPGARGGVAPWDARGPQGGMRRNAPGFQGGPQGPAFGPKANGGFGPKGFRRGQGRGGPGQGLRQRGGFGPQRPAFDDQPWDQQQPGGFPPRGPQGPFAMGPGSEDAFLGMEDLQPGMPFDGTMPPPGMSFDGGFPGPGPGPGFEDDRPFDGPPPPPPAFDEMNEEFLPGTPVNPEQWGAPAFPGEGPGAPPAPDMQMGAGGFDDGAGAPQDNDDEFDPHFNDGFND